MMAHTISLGGKDYELSTWNLNVLERLQERWDCSIGTVFKDLQKKLEKEGPKTMKLVVSALLIDKYPEMDEHAVGELIDLTNSEACSEALVESIKDAVNKPK